MFLVLTVSPDRTHGYPSGILISFGRCADYYLRERKPFRIFVYADMASRFRYYNDTTGQTWGDKRCHDLCVNKADLEIKALVPHLAAMLR